MNETPALLLSLAVDSGLSVVSSSLIAGQGSDRQYYRLQLTDGSTVIGTVGPDAVENRTFVNLAKALGRSGIAVPEVMACDSDYRAYIQSDLGSLSLYDALSRARQTGIYTDEDRRLLRLAVDLLVDVQVDGHRIARDKSLFYPASRMARREIMWDLNYWKYCFVKPAGITFDEARLESAMQDLACRCESLWTGLMLRDFQSRNIMIHGGRAWAIDFQGARRGPRAYDVVSLLWQVRLRLPDEVREELLEYYAGRMRARDDKFGEDLFHEELRLMLVLRMLQVLGAYGFRGLIEGKSNFADSIPGALATLSRAVSVMPGAGYLADVVNELAAIPRFRAAAPALVVTVRSFSYKRGLPDDTSDIHGGGYTFDCRAIHNPGRYEQYQQLTGLDDAVRLFLLTNSEVSEFLSHAEALVSSSVEVYLRRGFDSLTVDFGCTGGQHRSVYCAHAMAEYLHNRYGIHVVERHLVQGIIKDYPALCKQ